MGVRGLTSFLDSLPAAWKDVEMKKPAGDAVRSTPFPPTVRQSLHSENCSRPSRRSSSSLMDMRFCTTFTTHGTCAGPGSFQSGRDIAHTMPASAARPSRYVRYGVVFRWLWVWYHAGAGQSTTPSPSLYRCVRFCAVRLMARIFSCVSMRIRQEYLSILLARNFSPLFVFGSSMATPSTLTPAPLT